MWIGKISFAMHFCVISKSILGQSFSTRIWGISWDSSYYRSNWWNPHSYSCTYNQRRILLLFKVISPPKENFGSIFGFWNHYCLAINLPLRMNNYIEMSTTHTHTSKFQKLEVMGIWRERFFVMSLNICRRKVTITQIH